MKRISALVLSVLVLLAAVPAFSVAASTTATAADTDPVVTMIDFDLQTDGTTATDTSKGKWRYSLAFLYKQATQDAPHVLSFDYYMPNDCGAYIEIIGGNVNGTPVGTKPALEQGYHTFTCAFTTNSSSGHLFAPTLSVASSDLQADADDVIYIWNLRVTQSSTELNRNPSAAYTTAYHESSKTLSQYAWAQPTLSVSTLPTKTTYEQGEQLDTTGMVVTMGDVFGNTETITEGYVISGFESETVGIKEVVVTYSGLTASFTVTVTEPDPAVTRIDFDLQADGTTATDTSKNYWRYSLAFFYGQATQDAPHVLSFDYYMPNDCGAYIEIIGGNVNGTPINGTTVSLEQGFHTYTGEFTTTAAGGHLFAPALSIASSDLQADFDDLIYIWNLKVTRGGTELNRNPSAAYTTAYAESSKTLRQYGWAWLALSDGSLSQYADMRLTEICFAPDTKWSGSVYRAADHSADNPYEVTFDYHLTGGQVTMDSIAGSFVRLSGSSTTLQTGRHTFRATFHTTADQNTFAPRLKSTGNATLYMWNFRCTLGGTTLSGSREGHAITAVVNEAALCGFSWYDEALANEQPVTENTAVRYNEKHSQNDQQAEQMRLGIVNADEDIQPSATGRTYYVSSSGSNANDGLSPQTAWRTTEAVAAHSFQLNAGDVVLFERGGVYRGSTRMVSGVSYGAYGSGPKPCLYVSSRDYADPALWQPYATNVWRVHTPFLPDVGNIVFEHGEVCASDYKICDADKMTVDHLKSNYQYYHDLESGYLYMYYNGGNPGEEFESIELCPKTSVFGVADSLATLTDVTIDNLCIKYTGAHGVAIGNSEDITITNCEIGYIGGSLLGETVRYGNGIEIYGHVTDALIENNWIYQCFDAGYTNQGAGNATHLNVTVRNNLIEYCNYNIEIFTGSESGLIKDCVYEQNMLRFAGYGFGTNNRYGSDDSVTSSICYWRRVIPSENVIFRNNVLDTSYRFLVVAAYVNDQRENAPIFTDNVWVQHNGPKSAVALQVDTNVSGGQNHAQYELPSTDLSTMRQSVAVIDQNPTRVLHESYPLGSIAVATRPTKTVYEIGEQLDTTGLVLTLTYSDSSTETVTEGYTVSGYDPMTLGSQTVTVSYGNDTATFTVTVTVADSGDEATDPTVTKIDFDLQADGTTATDTSKSYWRYSLAFRYKQATQDAPHVLSFDYYMPNDCGAYVEVIGGNVNGTPVGTKPTLEQGYHTFTCAFTTNSASGHLFAPALSVASSDLQANADDVIYIWNLRVTQSGTELSRNPSAAYTTAYNESSKTLSQYAWAQPTLSVSTLPTKTTYSPGEALDTTGLVVTLSSVFGNAETVTDGYAVSGFESETAGDKTVTVTYGEYTATFTVTVTATDNG